LHGDKTSAIVNAQGATELHFDKVSVRKHDLVRKHVARNGEHLSQDLAEEVMAENPTEEEEEDLNQSAADSAHDLEHYRTPTQQSDTEGGVSNHTIIAGAQAAVRAIQLGQHLHQLALLPANLVQSLVEASMSHNASQSQSSKLGSTWATIIAIAGAILAFSIISFCACMFLVRRSEPSRGLLEGEGDAETMYVGQKRRTTISRMMHASGQESPRIIASTAQWVKSDLQSSMVGIIVSDMSGFTRLTREHGAIHFASLIIRMRQICLPILHHYGATAITTEADDFICVFPSAETAVQAADAMQKTVAKYNDSLPSNKKHFTLTLNGVGVDFGPGPLIDKHDKLFGSTVSNAYSLGEDLCEAGQILVTGNVKKELGQKSTTFATAIYERAHSLNDEEVAKNADGIFVLHYVGGEDFVIPKFDDGKYLHSDLMLLARRYDFSLNESGLAAIDEEVRDKYFVRRTVLMIAFDDTVTEDATEQMGLQYECIARLRKILEKYDAREVEDELFLFRDPVLAIKAAIEMREEVESQLENSKSNTAPCAYIKGYGVHEGQILFMPNTDVHWGDPVNTASKLGQDLAKDGELLISDECHRLVVHDVRMRELKFDLMQKNKSNVTFNCYGVSKKVAGEFVDF
jgi:class 3 adenylate cyclase